MEPTNTYAMKELHMSAEFFDEIKKEWELCITACETLESLFVTDIGLYWCLDNGKTYLNLKELTVSIIGRLTVDYTQRKTESCWTSVEQSIRSLMLWLTENQFPELRTIRIQWAPHVDVMTIEWGECEGYDRDGAVYDRDYSQDYESMNMDAVLNLCCNEWKDIDWSFLEPIGITSLHLPFMLHDVTDGVKYSFQVVCNSEYNEAAEEQVQAVLKTY